MRRERLWDKKLWRRERRKSGSMEEQSKRENERRTEMRGGIYLCGKRQLKNKGK